MNKTSIEWTDFSINPIRARNISTGSVGHYCQKISAGCKNCYASRRQSRFRMPAFQEQVKWSKDITVFFESSVLHAIEIRRKPAKVFWCDMTDMFGDWVPDRWIAKCIQIMSIKQNLIHQVLTKRPARMLRFLKNCKKSPSGWITHNGNDPEYEDPDGGIIVAYPGDGYPDEKNWIPKNIWFGASVEDQPTANQRIPELLQIRAAVHWVSIEPMLGEIDFSRWINRTLGYGEQDDIHQIGNIDWGVLGGETGPGARNFVLGHGKDIVRQFRSAGVPIFVKQVGSKPVNRKGQPYPHIKHHKGADMSEWPEELRVRELPETL